MAPELGRAILRRCAFASITPVWMGTVADRELHFGLSVAIAARSLAGCYFPRGCCVSACTSRGMKHSMGQLTFCQEGRKAVSALSCEDRHLCAVLGLRIAASPSSRPAFSAQCTQLVYSSKGRLGTLDMHYHFSQSMQALPSARD